MSVEVFWKLPERTRNAVEETILFYGECKVWYELDRDGHEYHITYPCIDFIPNYSPDYADIGKITRERLPEMWAHYSGREPVGGAAKAAPFSMDSIENTGTIKPQLYTCTFYEMDTHAKAECEAYVNGLSDAEREKHMRLEEYIVSENTICAGCGEFCKHMSIEEGPMYEAVYYCHAPRKQTRHRGRAMMQRGVYNSSHGNFSFRHACVTV